MKQTLLILSIVLSTIGASQTNVRDYKLKTAKAEIGAVNYSKGISILDELIIENKNDTIAILERAKGYHLYAKNEIPSADLFKKSIADYEIVNKLRSNSALINYSLFKVNRDYINKCGLNQNAYNRDKSLTKEMCIEKLKNAKNYLIEANRLNSNKQLNFDFDALLIEIDDAIAKNSF